MFKNIAEKIKVIAVIFMIVGSIASIITSIVLWSTYEPFIGFIVITSGILGSLLFSYLLYGFGELISLTTIIAQDSIKTKNFLPPTITTQKTTEEQNQSNDDIQNQQLHQTNKSVESVHDKELDDYEDKNGLYDDETINEPKYDECPNCFNKIKLTDSECSYCGYDLTSYLKYRD